MSGDRAQVDGEQIQVRAQVYQEERSIVPEEVKEALTTKSLGLVEVFQVQVQVGYE